jgi:SAM-dependent methyltransferase
MKFFKLKELRGVDEDSREIAILHQNIIKKKKFLNKLYMDFYKIFKKESIGAPEGLKIEIGSGGDFIKNIIPETITSDVLCVPNVDMNFSAEKMPFKDNSLSCIYLLNTLHHIQDNNEFFKECERCLVKEGRIIMIEPSNNGFSRLIYKKFHHEEFNEKAKSWKLNSNKRLSDANIALPWIIFSRDLRLFEKKFPNLELKKIETHTPFRSILSGGVSLKCLIPSWSYPFFKMIDKHFFPKVFGLFYTLKIEKIR